MALMKRRKVAPQQRNEKEQKKKKKNINKTKLAKNINIKNKMKRALEIISVRVY